jgi:two-component system nitrogen regulation response regulator NtrX
MKPAVLVIDDEEAIRSSLRMILEYEGYRFVGAASGREGVKAVETERPDVVLLDIKMPRMDGLEVLPLLRAEHPDLPVIVISGHGTIQTAVDAIRAGAADFLEKPLTREVVLHRLKTALESRKLRQEVDALRLRYDERYRIIGESEALAPVREAIARAAPTRASVLITGESGVGKELVARAIHRNSPRKDAPFIRVNCAAIPEELIESELFGHEKGSFTGASRDQAGKFVQADGGTIFLDEIGDMSLKTQAKVLRVLQDGEVEPVGAAKPFTVDVRVIAATNHDLEAAIAKGQFREDLYYRLNVVPIHVPPLRERSEDVTVLVREFAEAFRKENNARTRGFTPAALERMARLPWTGNVRELKNAVERVLILSDADQVDVKDLERVLDPASGAPRRMEAGPASGETASPAVRGARAGGIGAGSAETGAPVSPASYASLQSFKDAAERAYIVQKLRENDWNITQTARAIDTPRSNLYKKLEQYGIAREKDESAV